MKPKKKIKPSHGYNPKPLRNHPAFTKPWVRDTSVAAFPAFEKPHGVSVSSPDSKTETFPTGAQRDGRKGKGRFDLIPPRAWARLARHFETGALQYGERNWEKGMPVERFLDSALRHLIQYLAGARDEDHLIAATWNCLCAAETAERELRSGASVRH